MERQERWQGGMEHNVLSYDALDDQETLGVENVLDVTAPTMEDIAETHELRDRVRHAVALLSKAERKVIRQFRCRFRRHHRTR